MFTDLENDRPFLKLALLGFAGHGKTYTATEIAIGVHKLIGSQKPIAFYDTEKSAAHLLPLFRKHGIKATRVKSRSLAAASQAMTLCEAGAADILIIDSLTHVWESFIAAYLEEKKRYRLQFEDWGIIRPKWKREFSDVFLNSNVHIIFTGRAGYEYEDEKDEDGRRQIHKSGIKMKGETEQAFEPDVLVLMDQVQQVLGDNKRIYSTATILKDRTGLLHGKTLNADGEKVGPSFDDFYPAIKQLLDGAVRDAHGQDIPDTFHEFEQKFSKIGKEREVYIAEIEGAFELMGLGSGGQDKQIKAWTLNQVYAVNSIEAVAKKNNATIKEGLDVIRSFANEYKIYFNKCLDNGTTPDKAKVQEIMKSFNQPAK